MLRECIRAARVRLRCTRSGAKPRLVRSAFTSVSTRFSIFVSLTVAAEAVGARSATMTVAAASKRRIRLTSASRLFGRLSRVEGYPSPTSVQVFVGLFESSADVGDGLNPFFRLT